MAKNTGKAWLRWAVFAGVIVALLFVLAGVWSLVAHRDSIPGVHAVQSDTTAVVGLQDPPASLDIRTQPGDGLDQVLLGNVYETLVSRNQSNQLTAGLASGWEISKNALSYRLSIRSGLRFSNGDTLDASDVVWSLERIITNKYVGYDQLGDVTSIENPDSTTVAITLGKPNPLLLRALSQRAGIVYDSHASIDYSRQCLGSGPFTVSDYTQGQSITLARNPNYHGTPAASTQVTVRYFSGTDTLMAALRDGSIQMAVPSPASAIDKLAQYPSLKTVDGNSTTKVLLAYNCGSQSIFSDEQVRKATRYLVDSEAIADSQTDSASALGGPISPLEPGYEDLTGLFTHDESRARSMLSYFADSYLGTVVFLVPQGQESLGQKLTEQLESSGQFTVRMEVVDDQSLHNRMASGDYTLALLSMDGTDDASAFSDPDSVFHYQNGQSEKLYATAMESTNDRTYQSNLAKYARAVSEDAASDWLYVRKSRVVVNTKLDGYPTNMTNIMLPLKNLSMH
ncbi:MAG: ABC transporter substrate-binding protein [Bifidobacterium sp.]|jgi:ABC-type transport system substrate-binding protein|nr:ABC transporter substrate-binding protein [Bifidobacterium sp.]